jgi:hypothetical protein
LEYIKGAEENLLEKFNGKIKLKNRRRGERKALSTMDTLIVICM